ncbi:PQQ-dependent sugar dehydrogenase [Leucobacter musarum]|uniref:PQQ-dependent sugar dehydrogenase n=1 Tax=Leucobacter musarum TaxID=1930747 RepID=UPI0006A78713|nr:PQQ-dependent sugar dehydrogenase [Leucobacter musarum]
MTGRAVPTLGRHGRAGRVSVGAVTAALVGIALVGCTDPVTGSAPSSGDPAPTAAAAESFESSVVAEGLAAPWSIAFHGDTPVISERDSGRVLTLSSDGSTREITTVAGVTHGGEGGLLGLAVRDDALYVYATRGSENQILRYPLSGAATGLGVGEPEVLVDGIPAGSTHNGGRLAFGPDGMLYATTGDAGDRESAQDPSSLGGKILRVTADGGVPDDNPVPGSPVWTLGHRNPQGLAWAPDGTMYASEFGQNTWDELNVIEAGNNYGWPEVEGRAGVAGFVDPVQQWTPEEASPSGIAVHDGHLWISHLRGSALRAVPLDDLSASTVHFAGEFGRIRDAVETPDGRLWVLTNNTDGRGTPRAGDDRVLDVTVEAGS